MKIENETKLDFSDVLFRPKRSTLSSRKEVQTIRQMKFKYSSVTWEGVPIMSSNMDTISSVKVFEKLSSNKMLTCFHKYIDMSEIISSMNRGNTPENIILSTGISQDDLNRLEDNLKLLKAHNIDINFICVDVANGYMFKLVEFCRQLRDKYPDKIIMAGNVVTREMTEELILNGKVDIVKVGIGSGAVCTTRLKTGVGMPQLSAVMECADAAHGLGAMIISDGGICHPGDVSKAYGGGADFVMMGSILSGHDESPGDIIEEEGKKYKLFYGMSSDSAMKKHFGGVAKYRSSEGKTVKILLKGPIQDTLDDIMGGIRSTCTYIGAKHLKDINKCTTFIKVNRVVNTFYQ